MAKQILTEMQIILLLTQLNPHRVGKDANPIIMGQNTFVLTGKKAQTADGVAVKQFVQVSKLSDEAKKANPGLTNGKYLRLTKTEQVKDVTTALDEIVAPRKPLADNLFENQNPLLFETLVALLKKKVNEENKAKHPNLKLGDYIHFVEMEDDKEGNPRLKLLNPVKGAFVTINYPAHYRIDTKTGKELKGSAKDISTGSYKDAQKIVFRSLELFLFPADVEKLQSIAINRYQKLVEPMLAEEVVISTLKAGVETQREVKSDINTERDVIESAITDKDDDVAVGPDGMPLP